MKIVLEDERPISWNKMYSGQHWTKRKEEVDRMGWLMRKHLLPGMNKYSKRVTITITAYFKDHPIDPDNICSKIIIDALKKYVLVDDTYLQIDSVTTQTRMDKKQPRIEVIIDVLETELLTAHA